jgi:hypothetical protein
MQIDHDRNEPSHKALKVIGVLTAVLVLAVAIPLTLGVNWSVRQLPSGLTLLLAGIAVGAGIGFALGRRDAIRQFRTPGKEE